ncbi:MAG: response regulator transcription factor [Flavobacteriaceae bacterium]
MKTTQPLSFLISDDHSIVRQGVAMIIKELFFKPKIFLAGTFKETLDIVHQNSIDLLVLDINFPDGNSLKILEEIKKIQPELKIIIFTAYDEDIYALRYLNAGATGYLNKGCSEDEMKNALNSMVLYGKYITQNIKDKILDSYISKKPINPLETLSSREIEVARLFIKGYGNMEIAETLNIKKSTVSTFKNRIFEKLEINNIAELIEFFSLYG